MKIGNILKYGIFDSKKQYAGMKKTPKRSVVAFEFDYILSCEDTAVSFIDGESYPLKEHTLIVRKPEQTSNSILHFKCYCLHLQIDERSPFYGELSALPSYYPFVDGARYREIFEKLFKHLSASESNMDDDYTASKILELFYFLKKDGGKTPEKNPAVLGDPDKIRRAIEYMKENFQQKITLATLGELTGYTPNHFQKIFSQSVRVSPQKYLENLRLKYAKYLLSQTEKPIVEIAYDCGFSSQSHFTKTFKTVVKTTPYEFRRSSMVVYE